MEVCLLKGPALTCTEHGTSHTGIIDDPWFFKERHLDVRMHMCSSSRNLPHVVLTRVIVAAPEPPPAQIWITQVTKGVYHLQLVLINYRLVDQSAMEWKGCTKATTALEVRVRSQPAFDVCAVFVNPMFAAGTEDWICADSFPASVKLKRP